MLILNEEANRPERRPLTQKCVLIIDDNKMLLDTVQDIFDAVDIPNLTARGGKEGVAIFKFNQANIGLVIIDLMMPILDGIETLNKLRQLDPHVPIVLSSGYYPQRLHLDNLPINGFLAKPFTITQLLAQVENSILK